MKRLPSFFPPSMATHTLGQAATDLTEIFVENKTRRMERSFDALESAHTQHNAEFGAERVGLFDRIVNGLNRLPRPMLALGTLGLFVYAMVDPVSFAARMQGLAHVPEPLWWLLGAIVSFYFGARELHYFRSPTSPISGPRQARISSWRAAETGPVHVQKRTDTNPALEAWQQTAPR